MDTVCAACLGRKVLRQPVRRNIRGNIARINPGAGSGNCVTGSIGSKYLHSDVPLLFHHLFMH